MQQVGILLLVSVAVSAAAPVASPAPQPATLETSKSVAQFDGCFVKAQDRAALAWSYVPRPHGGTFSNAGAKGAHRVYFLAVSDSGAGRQVRLESASDGAALDRRVARAVDQCI